MFEHFTDRARKVMALANVEAIRFQHEYIGTEHILLGLVKEGSGVGANTLKNLDVNLRKVRLEVEKLVKNGPDIVTMKRLPQTPRAKKVIEHAIEAARDLHHNYVGTEHLLIGLITEFEGIAAQVLMNLGLTRDKIQVEVLNLIEAGAGDASNSLVTSPETATSVALKQHVIIVISNEASTQDGVNARLDNLGSDWRIQSAITMPAFDGTGFVYVTTIVVEKITPNS